MTDPWFTPEVYAIMPGLIVGFSGGAYGVLLGLFVNAKNFKRIFLIMSAVVLFICLGVIIFGVIAMLYDQPEGTCYDFASTGLIGVVVVGVIYGTANKIGLFSNEE